MISLRKGFTLIELLVVIAVLGVLATVVIVAINPIQQLARGRDSGRTTTISQLGNALVTYGTANNNSFVNENGTWITSLVNAGEIQTVPSAITISVSGIVPCAVNSQNAFCYDSTTATGGAPAIVFARLEASSNIARCTAAFPATNRAYAIYSTSLGKGGIVCTTNADPTVGANAGGTAWLP